MSAVSLCYLGSQNVLQVSKYICKMCNLYHINDIQNVWSRNVVWRIPNVLDHSLGCAISLGGISRFYIKKDMCIHVYVCEVILLSVSLY